MSIVSNSISSRERNSFVRRQLVQPGLVKNRMRSVWAMEESGQRGGEGARCASSPPSSEAADPGGRRHEGCPRRCARRRTHPRADSVADPLRPTEPGGRAPDPGPARAGSDDAHPADGPVEPGACGGAPCPRPAWPVVPRARAASGWERLRVIRMLRNGRPRVRASARPRLSRCHLRDCGPRRIESRRDREARGAPPCSPSWRSIRCE